MENVRIWKYSRRTQIDLTRKRLSKSPVVQFSGTVKSKSLIWGCSSAGRAPALQAGGHGFESHHLHQKRKLHNNGEKMEEIHGKLNGLIAQQVRARA